MYNEYLTLNKMMKILIILILFISFAGTAYSYPENQMEECVSSAINNPATKSISKASITNYCDCALTAIIDENKNIRESGYECAQKYFN